VAYSDRATVKESLSIPAATTSEDSAVDAALAAADAAINAYCGRTFVVPGAATAKVYGPNDNVTVLVDDIAQVSGLVVKIDTANDGVYDTTLTVTTDFIVEGNTGPFRELLRVDGSSWPRYRSQRPTIEVTAYWGYAMTVPDNVVQASTLMAARFYQRRSSPLGFVAGFEGESIRISHRDPDMRALLAGYRIIGVA
jgi:hypothetical protein